MKEFIDDVTNWVMDFVSIYNDSLGHVPCPFAKQAILDNKINWFTAQNISDLETIVIWQSDKNLWMEKEVIIIGMRSNVITPEELFLKIKKINEEILMPNGLIALEDHPDSPEYVNSVKMNQGKWILVLIQSQDKLSRASNILKKQGYYDNWSKENMDDVVNWRI